TYTWHAAYSGDTNNLTAHDNGQNESVMVIKASPVVTTNATGVGTTGAGTILSGSSTVSGAATLSGAVNPTGHITFTLRQPDGNIDQEGSVTVNGNGTYNAPQTVTATEAGTYTWHASYSGDANNNGSQDNGQNESVNVTKASPTVITLASEVGGTVGSAILSD